MPLTLRPAGLSSPAYRDWLDYVVVEDGCDVGRVYEGPHSKPELRWFWVHHGVRRSQAMVRPSPPQRNWWTI
jgi:hypothetical protein